MDFPESTPSQPSRREQRAQAMVDLRLLGQKIRAERFRPDVYSVAQRLGLSSQAMAQRLLATRRLDERLALLVPQAAAPPTPEDILHADDASSMPPLPQRAEEPQHELSGERLMLVACNIAASIECLNSGALLGREELQGLIRNYGQPAMRFGLKFRSAVPIYLLELLREGRGDPMQLAATALLVWSEVENHPLGNDVRENLQHMRPVRVQTLDNPQETVDLVRYALTATKDS
jgi:hypothetical protein